MKCWPSARSAKFSNLSTKMLTKFLQMLQIIMSLLAMYYDMHIARSANFFAKCAFHRKSFPLLARKKGGRGQKRGANAPPGDATGLEVHNYEQTYIITMQHGNFLGLQCEVQAKKAKNSLLRFALY